jgi:hypothetical protein
MSELMAQGERLRDVEDRLKGVLRRLDEVEAALVSQPSWNDERFGIWVPPALDSPGSCG